VALKHERNGLGIPIVEVADKDANISPKLTFHTATWQPHDLACG
jgi:hypothetical protein